MRQIIAFTKTLKVRQASCFGLLLSKFITSISGLSRLRERRKIFIFEITESLSIVPAYSASEESYTESLGEDCKYEPLSRRHRACSVETEDAVAEDHDDDEDADVEEDRSCDLDMDKVHLTLECKELWMKFHELGTEMIITKAGRFVYFSVFVDLL